MEKIIYRVMCLEGEEDCYDLLLPGGNITYTGFWTPNLECAMNIMGARHMSMYELDGSYSDAMIFSTTLDNVVVDNNLISKFKSGDDLNFDNDELFVVEIKDMNKIVNYSLKE